MSTIIRYVLLTALRDRIFLVLLLGIVVATGISGALAATSMEEKAEMMLSFSAASARIMLIIGVIVFVAFHVRAAFDSREIDVILSRPISRHSLVFAYWTGFAVVATILSLLAALVIYLVGPIHLMGFFTWTASLVAEALLVVAIALFAALIVKSAVSTVMICLGFYTLARMMGYFIATAQSKALFGDPTLNQIGRSAIDIVAMFMPRLDYFADTAWLIYGTHLSKQAILFGTQSLVFIPLLLLAAIIDFRRKQF